MNPSVPSPLRTVLRSFRAETIALAGFSAVVTGLMLVPSIYMLQVYDRVLASRSEATLLALTMLVLGLFAMLGLLEHVRATILLRASVRLEGRLAGPVFRAAFDDAARGAAHPAAAAQDLAALRQFVGGPVPALFFDAPLAVVFLLASFALDPWLGWFVCASIAVLALLAFWSEHSARPRLLESGRHVARANATLVESIEHVESVRALGMLRALQSRWMAETRQALAHQVDAGEAAGRIAALGKFVRLAAQSLALGLGALLVLEERITPGMMIAASILLGRCLAPIEGLIAATRQIIGAREAADRLDRLLARAEPRVERTPLPAPRGLLSVENLHVGPPGSTRPLLRGIAFELPPGRVLGVIGPSGAGKSTLARALVGIWPPSTGHVRLDGAELGHWPPGQLACAIGFLPQEVELFDGTVAENIARLGSAAPEAVIAAARSAGVHDMILRLPEGYETRLGHGGLRLSGGQRQRIALARALYGRPALIVLDEPNSNLDDMGEQALLHALQACKAAGQTVVIASHRKAVLQVADSILLLQDGEMLISGPRDAVLGKLAVVGSAPSVRAEPIGAGKEAEA